MISFLDRLGKTTVSTVPFLNKINNTRKNKSDNLIPVLIKEGIEYKTNEEKARRFANKLINIFNEPRLYLKPGPGQTRLKHSPGPKFFYFFFAKKSTKTRAA